MKIHADIGYTYRVNDSLRSNNLQKVNTSNNYYLKTRLIQNTHANLALFVNYRTLKHEDEVIRDEQSLNSRLQYSQKLFKQKVLIVLRVTISIQVFIIEEFSL